MIFLCCSTTGQEVINKVALESRQAGREREEIQAEELKEAIAEAVYNHKNSKRHSVGTNALMYFSYLS